MTEVARDVKDPETGVTALERNKSFLAANTPGTKAKKEILGKNSLSLGALGSGSDYTAFIDHLGIPSLNIGYGGEGGDGVYHSIYDSYDHYKRFVDPTLAYGVALAKTAGRAALRLANADVLPFDFKTFHRTVSGYQSEVITLLDNLRETTEVENQLVREKRYVLAADPTKKSIPPVQKDLVPFVNFSSLQNAISRLEKSASLYAEQLLANPNTSKAQEVNQLVFRAEQKLLSPTGLPRRAWFKHTVYAPGYYTGYGVKTLPGIREAIEQRNWTEVQEQIEIAAHAIQEYTNQIDSATKLLQAN